MTCNALASVSPGLIFVSGDLGDDRAARLRFLEALIGVPTIDWPGFLVRLDDSFGVFLLPLLFVMLDTTIERGGDVVAVQTVSRRRPRAVDFRAIHVIPKSASSRMRRLRSAAAYSAGPASGRPPA